MRSLLVFLLAVLSLAASPTACAQTERLASAVLGEERSYQVQLPASYSWGQDRRYPVLYVLDGGTHFDHVAASTSFLAAQGEIPEMIVVAIGSTVRIRDFTQSDWASHWVGGGGAAYFKLFLSSELIPAVEQRYRTDGFRMLSGHSAGGQFVLYCLTAEPSLFQGYMALSPSLDWDHNLPQRSLEEAFRATNRLPAFLYVARSDDRGQALADFEALVVTLGSTAPEGFRWHSAAFPDETHGSIALLAQIDALRQLYRGYRFHDDLLQEGLPAAEAHFKRVSEVVGWPLPVPEGVINDLGYEALAEGRVQDAIALFTRNVQAHPNSANAYDSLADGHAEAGQWKEAAGASARALELATAYAHPERAYFEGQVAKMNARSQDGGGSAR